MGRRVLDVGQCDPDHSAIRQMLEREFAAEVVRANGASDALAALRAHDIDLVLVNRKLDMDYSDGLDVLKAIKQDSALAQVPVMLVTNYAEHQQAAVDAGAVWGFGKAELDSPVTLVRLAGVLG